VAAEFIRDWRLIFFHAGQTVWGILAGYVAAVVFALAASMAMIRWPLIERMLMPILVASQSVPKIAIAPLILLWVGAGAGSKLLVVALAKWIDRAYIDLVMAAAWALVLPALFSLSRKDGLDRWIGELSYPVYLVHFFIIGLLELALHTGLTNFAAEPLSWQLHPWTGTLAAILSIAVAALLNRTLFGGLEKLRHRKIAKVAPAK
jgi:peptidoglycan/LPS O-acetylase OafA/YrhL